jgi:hypothetical protein
MVSLRDILMLGVGALLGVAVKKYVLERYGVDPILPPGAPVEVRKLVYEAIKASDWARAWASRFCGPPEHPGYEECINRLVEHVARKMSGY